MSAALGLKVRTVVSLHLWDLFHGPAPWASPAAGQSAVPAARTTYRLTVYRRHADTQGRLLRVPVSAKDSKVAAKRARQPNGDHQRRGDQQLRGGDWPGYPVPAVSSPAPASARASGAPGATTSGPGNGAGLGRRPGAHRAAPSDWPGPPTAGTAPLSA